MKALMQIGYGSLNENLQIQEVEIPRISANEVFIKVHSASINPHDYKVVLGEFKKMKKLDFPTSVGSDFSGIIVEIGENINHFVIGDEIFGTSHGTIAEFCKADVSTISLKPRSLSFNDISVLPVVGMTTIQSFNRIGGINKGDKILIHAGSGGVGTFAIQYAKLKGAFVYTTTSKKNSEWVKELGADVVIDYKKENYLDICSDLDIVFDTLGNQFTFDAFKTIKQGGKVISLLPVEINKQVAKEFKIPKLIAFFLSLKPSKIKKLVKDKNATYEFVFMRPNQLSLLEINNLIENNKIKPIIEKVFEFNKSIDAFEHLEKGHTKGKLVIKIQDTI